MKIKHLIILLFVNYSCDAMSSSVVTLSTGATSAPTVRVKSLVHSISSCIHSLVVARRVINNLAVSKSVVSGVCGEQIIFVDKKLMPSEYVKSNVFRQYTRSNNKFITTNTLFTRVITINNNKERPAYWLR